MMKDIVVINVVVAIIVLLVAAQCDARSVSDDDLARWKRQEGLQWECSVNVDGCCVQFNCTTNAIIDVTTVDCSLDGRPYDCPPALVFEINANLATANDGNYHGLVFSVRGIYDRLTLTLPWNFRFRVDRFYCDIEDHDECTSTTTSTTTTQPPTTTSTTSTTIATTTSTTSTTTQPPTTQPPTTTSTTSTTTSMTTQPPPPTITITTQLPPPPPTTTTTTQPPPPPPTTTTTTQPPPPPPPTTTTTTQSPPPIPEQQSGPIALCRIGKDRTGNLLLFCKSDLEIQNITYTINDTVTGTVDGDVVNISYDYFISGECYYIILLIYYENGQTYIFCLKYIYIVGFRSCLVRCSARYTYGEGLQPTCTIDGDTSGAGITSIVYDVNNLGLELAYNVPVFHISSNKFRQGTNSVFFTVSHIECGIANIALQFVLPSPPENIVEKPPYGAISVYSTDPEPNTIIHFLNWPKYIVFIPLRLIISQIVKILGVIICIFCRIPGVGLEIKCVVSGDWTGEDITAIFYEFNNGPLAIASTLPKFMIGENEFQDGRNNLSLSINHAEYGVQNLQIEFDLNLICPLLPSTSSSSCDINCQYSTMNDGKYYQFICDVTNGGSIVSVNYTANEVYTVTGLEGTFRITREGLIIGTNTIDLVFIMCCNSQPQTVYHTLSLELQRGLVSTFRVDLIRYSITGSVGGGEVCNVSSRARVEDDNVVVTVVLCNDSPSVFGYSVNGADSQPGSDFQVTHGPTMSLHKNLFRVGMNTLALTVYSFAGSQVQLTLILNIVK